MPKWKGMCRIRGLGGTPDMVRVTDGDMTFDDVTEEAYRLACMKPPLEDLRWCASKLSSSTDSSTS